MAEFGRGYVTIVPVYERGAQSSVEKFAKQQGLYLQKSLSRSTIAASKSVQKSTLGITTKFQSALRNSIANVGIASIFAENALKGLAGKALSTRLGNNLQNALKSSSVVSKLSSGFNAAFSKASSVASGVKNFASNLSKSIANSGIASKFGQTALRLFTPASRTVGNAMGTGITSGVSGAAGKVTNLLSSAIRSVPFAGLIVGGLAVAASPLIAALTTATTAGWKRLTTKDTSVARLTAMGHSASEVAAYMDSANAAVKGTTYPLDEAANAMSMLAAAGGKLNDGWKGADATLRSLVNASALGGNTSLKELTDVFQTVQIQGRVTGLELKRFAQNNVPAITALAKSFGVTEDSIREMASNGEISLSDLNKALHEFGGNAALEFGKTLPGRMSNFKAALGRLGEEMWKPLYDGLKADDGAFAIMTKWVDGIAKSFDFSWIGGAANKVVNGAVQALDKLYNYLDENDIPTKVIGDITSTLENVDFEQLFNDISDFASDVKSTLEGLAAVFSTIGDAINTIKGVFSGGKEKGSNLQYSPGNLQELQSIDVNEYNKKGQNAGSALTAGMAKGIKNGQKNIKQSAQAAINSTSTISTAVANQKGAQYSTALSSGINAKKSALYSTAQSLINSTSGLSTAVANQKGAQYTTGVQTGINSKPRPSITIDLKKGATLLWNASTSITGTGVFAQAAKNALMTGYVSLMAKGGVVNSPHLAVFGEAGTEAVVPLERNTQWIHKVANDMSGSLNGFGGNGAPNLYINNAQVNSSKYIEQAFYNLMQATARKGYM